MLEETWQNADSQMCIDITDEDFTCMSFPEWSNPISGWLLCTDLDTTSYYWPMVGPSLGVIGVCLPLLRPIIIQCVFKTYPQSFRRVFSFGSSRHTIASKGRKFPGRPEHGFRNDSVRKLPSTEIAPSVSSLFENAIRKHCWREPICKATNTSRKR